MPLEKINYDIRMYQKHRELDMAITIRRQEVYCISRVLTCMIFYFIHPINLNF